MNLTIEESAAVLKLAARVDYDIDTARQLKAAGRLNAVESHVLDKLLDYAGR